MRILAALAFLSLSWPASTTEQKYTFTIDSQSAGTCTMMSTKLPDGGVEYVVDLKVDFSGHTGRQRQEMRYDKDGKPTLAELSIEDGTDKTVQKIVFGVASLTQTTTTKGKSEDKLVRYPLGRDMKQPSQLWFLVTHPKTGDVSYEMIYDPKSASFHRHKRTNVGPTDVEVDGKKYRSFQTTDLDMDDNTATTQWVDAQGMPFRLIIETSSRTVGQTMEFDRVKS